MPKVKAYTPSWLSRGSPGFDLFNPSVGKNQANGLGSENEGETAPARTIATRGTEVFYAQGNEIRWTDLARLKEQSEAGQEEFGRKSRRDEYSDITERHRQAYRVLKLPGSRMIKQLLISPNGLYLAIASSHSLHVAILPDPSALASEDSSLIKLKTYHIGPTTHVVERSAIAAVIWHPLGVNGDCLVTVTVDAVVRLWELERSNRWSFDQPAFAVDLKKLANGLSTAEDFSPSKYGTSAGFSPDSFEMEVASACFGASNTAEQSTWSAMTLWIAMREGDVYALCPLLPSHFQAHSTTLQQLLSTQQVNSAAIEGLDGVPEWAKNALKQQSAWTLDLESQLDADEGYDSSLPTQILKRPLHPSPVPKLQGPFQFSPDPDQIFDITDICVLATEPRPDVDPENDFDTSQARSSAFETLCLVTSDGKANVCISMNKIEPRWLPTKRASASSSEPDDDTHEMLIVESISLIKTEGSTWPVFTPDITCPSRVFITHHNGVAHIDVSSLLDAISLELAGEGDSGIDFRMGMLTSSTQTTCTQVITFDSRTSQSTSNEPTNTTACINLHDPDLGHFILTLSANQSSTVTLDSAPPDLDLIETISTYDPTSDDQALTDQLSDLNLTPLRQAYQPPSALYDPSALPSFLDTFVNARSRRTTADPIRLSPQTLDLLMQAHRVLSHETHKLGVAAAELFARCERLTDEFRGQIAAMREAAERVDAVTRPDDGGDDGEGDENVREAVESRLHAARMNQEALVMRYEEVRRKVAKLEKRPFSEKEREWKGEVKRLGRGVLVRIDDDDGEEDRDAEDGGEEEGRQVDGTHDDDEDERRDDMTQRFETVRQLREELLEQYREQKDKQGPENIIDAEVHDAGFNVALDRRRARSVEIEELLDRQAALVDATKEKLRRLQAVVV